MSSTRGKAAGSFGRTLAVLLVTTSVLRIVYVRVQAASDPTSILPILDGEYYLNWARSIAANGAGPEGAYYLAPLYPHLLAGYLEVFGDRLFALYLLQNGLVVGAAWCLALAGRSLVGDRAGLMAAALLLLYHPTLYFASQPIGESASVALLCLSLWLAAKPARGAAAAIGLAAGVAALSRPNLLLVPAVWSAIALSRRQWTRCVLLLTGLALVLVPVLVRNWIVSGHPVPVSSNAGITLYHGNAPGATGVYMRPESMSDRLSEQREDATRVASLHTGQTLDPVEADRFWGRQAVRARLDDPGGTARLLGRRLALTTSNAEIGLGYAPALDRNPLRWSAPVPFAAILGLAAAGLVLGGWRGTGGGLAWGAMLACAVTPLVFYVSSRYRLPMAAMLCIPAAAGLSALVDRRLGSRRLHGLATLAVVAGWSLFAPTWGVVRSTDAVALSNRASIWNQLGRMDAAEMDLRAALEKDPSSVPALFNLGAVLEATGRPEEATAAYRRVLEIDAGHADSAGNLGGLLVAGGNAAEAVPLLRRALEQRPGHAVCWTNLVVALVSEGEHVAAADAARQAGSRGIDLDPGLIDLATGSGG